MPWHAIQTLCNREERVAAELARIGIERYLPVYREKRRWSNRWQWVSIPVFRGYLFVQLPADDCSPQRRQVVEITGCIGIVGRVSDPEIDSVRRLMAAGGKPLDPLTRVRQLGKGEPIRVKCGPLTGIEGVLLRHKGKDRIVVSLNMIHGAVASEINIRDVLILEGKKAA